MLLKEILGTTSNVLACEEAKARKDVDSSFNTVRSAKVVVHFVSAVLGERQEWKNSQEIYLSVHSRKCFVLLLMCIVIDTFHV